MPRPRQTSEKIIAMQSHIMDTTLSLLDELEPDEVSIRKIAQRAHISPMAIYCYFKNRDELVKAIIGRQEKQVSERFNEVLADSNDNNIIPNLRAALTDYLNIVKARPRIFRLLWITPLRPPSASFHRNTLIEEQINLFSDLFQKGMARGVFIKRDPKVASLTMISLINAPMFLFFQDLISDSTLRDRVIGETLDITLRYITGE